MRLSDNKFEAEFDITNDDLFDMFVAIIKCCYIININMV